MDSFYKENGIRHLFTMPYKPQQNGIKKKKKKKYNFNGNDKI